MLDDGEIAEFDVPYNLLQIHDGHFRKLVDQTGELEAKRMEEQARKAMSSKLDDSIRESGDRYSPEDQPIKNESLIGSPIKERHVDENDSSTNPPITIELVADQDDDSPKEQPIKTDLVQEQNDSPTVSQSITVEVVDENDVMVIVKPDSDSSVETPLLQNEASV